MNLDHDHDFAQLDSQDMLAEIDGLPDQLLEAWELGQGLSLPGWEGVSRILVAGMGGSAIGGSLLAAYAADQCGGPICVHRNYDLPAWATGPETLVIACSHSGNTEETRSAFATAQERKCRSVAITTGGGLEETALESGAALWKFAHEGQPRAAVGYSFGLLLAVLENLGLMPPQTDAVQAAVEELKAQQAQLRAGVPLENNPAKQLAEQIQGSWVSVFGAGILEPVARRWKGQFSELAKAWAQYEALPEADHNTLAGIENPRPVLDNTQALFLQAPDNHPRNQLRISLTRDGFLAQGVNSRIIPAAGSSRLSQMWTALHLGDYTAYYLAMLYGVDPSPVAAIQSLKRAMREES